MTGTHYTQFCALARAAEIIGERWTLLIMRELLLGPKRFGDLLDHLDGMSPTLLTARLTALIECNVVRRTVLPRPINAQVYELTDIGRGTPVPDISIGLIVTHGKKSAGFTVAGGDGGTAIRKGVVDCRGSLEAP